MEKFYKFENNNGIYVCFNEYQYEEDYPEFLELISKKMNIELPSSWQGPYSIYSEFEYAGHTFVAMFDGYTGCCLLIRTAPDAGIIAEEIFKLFVGA